MHLTVSCVSFVCSAVRVTAYILSVPEHLEKCECGGCRLDAVHVLGVRNATAMLPLCTCWVDITDGGEEPFYLQPRSYYGTCRRCFPQHICRSSARVLKAGTDAVRGRPMDHAASLLLSMMVLMPITAGEVTLDFITIIILVWPSGWGGQ